MILLLFCSFFLRAEIIRFSRLEKKPLPFSLKKDIFFPIKLISPEERATLQNRVSRDQTEQVAEKEDSKKEIQRSISFEGYVEKNNRIHALISLNGEYFIVSQGDVFLESIKIVKIERKRIFLEVESQPVEIQLKGDNDE
jgi:hypothetical protein